MPVEVPMRADRALGPAGPVRLLLGGEALRPISFVGLQIQPGDSFFHETQCEFFGRYGSMILADFLLAEWKWQNRGVNAEA
jgi:hypothetical protein